MVYMSIRKSILSAAFLIFNLSIAALSVFSDNSGSSFYIGISAAAGGRYDNVRMCIASPAGTPGGIAMEPAALVLEYRADNQSGFGVYIPVGRPLLFAFVPNMLQFLPEFYVSLIFPINEDISFILHTALGGSFHYGPDYLSDQENRGPNFFAAGPRISLFAGIGFGSNLKHEFQIGIKPYFEYLFSDYLSGFVVGGEIDFQYHYRLSD